MVVTERTEVVTVTYKTKAAATKRAAADQAWADETGIDFSFPEGTKPVDLLTTAMVRTQKTTVEVRQDDLGGFQVVWVTSPL